MVRMKNPSEQQKADSLKKDFPETSSQFARDLIKKV
jgi:hypothetical protein